MKISFQQQVVIGIAVSILLVFLVGLSSYKALILQQENARMVDHTRDVIKVSGTVENLLLNAESNTRGLIITKNSAFETSFQKASHQIWNEVNTLKKLTSDNPDQAIRIDTLSMLLHEKLDIMSIQLDFVKLKESVNQDTLKLLIRQGKNLSMRIEFLFNKIENAEQLLLEKRETKAQQSASRAKMFIVVGTGFFILVIFVLFYFIDKTYLAQIASEAETKKANEELEKISIADREKNWILGASMEVSVAIRGEPTGEQLAENLLNKLAEITNAVVGVMYLHSERDALLERSVVFSIADAEQVPRVIIPGEGVLGQILHSKTSIKRLYTPPGYLQVVSGAGKGNPGVVIVKSLIFEGKMLGIIELGFFDEPAPRTLKLLETVSESAAIALMAARARKIMQELLDRTQKQAEELVCNQDQLTVTNQELLRQTALLQVSEEELRVQQEELKQINAELEEKAFMLEEQKNTLEQASEQLRIKADELEKSGKFKNEFLANMSHELRTPLNSILILASILEENKGARLNSEEQRYASVIHNSGSDLLLLINDILDLAKVESGNVELHYEDIATELLILEIRNSFAKVAEHKGLTFLVEKGDGCPESLFLDHLRLLQILRNLLSNALKFTSAPGTVSLTIFRKDQQLHFKVSDTGIGIPVEKQQAIFEAFQQADGSISRKYGGTGLGLSITKELTRLFNGTISLVSQPGVGSEFTLIVPLIEHSGPAITPEITEINVRQSLDTEVYSQVNRLLLIEDDDVFAENMAEKARESGFEVAIAENGHKGLELVQSFRPTAIILDMHLPDISGEELLKQLKADPRAKLIPVHIISAGDEGNFNTPGVVGFLQKPVERESAEELFHLLKLEGKNLSKQRILLVEDDTFQSKYLGNLLADHDILVLYAYSVREARGILSRDAVDGIILDIRLTDESGLDFLEEIKLDPALAELPVVINTAQDLSQADLTRLMKYAHPVVMKTKKSNDRLLDEVKLFLKNMLPKPASNQPLEEVVEKPIAMQSVQFSDCKVLLADDDMRNIFALSAILEEAGFTITIANNGKEAIEKLEEVEDIDLVLMDMMMPEMDGIEAIRHIRSDGRWNSLPIIAVTAKAMQGDREQCIEAGANDYITKPVDINKLFQMITGCLQVS
jgi:signal transduction histidine kinase/CheY-like chemotaxis protein/CHASE3 domain sensor protein